MQALSHWVSAVAAAAFLLVSAGMARADEIDFTASGSDQGGLLSASARITVPSADHLEVDLTNLLSAVGSAAQAISGIEILFGPAQAPRSATLTALSGSLYTLSRDKKQVIATADPVATPATTHWSTQLSGNDLWLATAGTGAKSGSPDDMILGLKYSSVNSSLINQHNDVYLGSVVFDLAAAGLTSVSQIVGVNFEFGTGPDMTLAGVKVATVAEPRSLALLAAPVLLLWAMARRRRRVMAAGS